MEIIVFLVAAAVVGFIIYTRLNKDKADGSHPLDSLGKQNAVQPTPVVETKPVEAINAIAEPAKCGCGRSPTGFCVGLHKLTTEEWSVHADNPNRVVATAPEVKPKTSTKKVTARIKKVKEVAKEPAKKGRKPKVKEVAKKPVARKLKNS